MKERLRNVRAKLGNVRLKNIRARLQNVRLENMRLGNMKDWKYEAPKVFLKG